MPDLHSRIATEIDRRLAVARAATPGPWDVRTLPEHRWTFADAISAEDAQYFRDNDPSDSIRRLEAASRVLSRHAPLKLPGWTRPVCAHEYADHDGWPVYLDNCEDLLDLAASFGLDTEGSTTDAKA